MPDVEAHSTATLEPATETREPIARDLPGLESRYFPPPGGTDVAPVSRRSTVEPIIDGRKYFAKLRYQIDRLKKGDAWYAVGWWFYPRFEFDDGKTLLELMKERADAEVDVRVIRPEDMAPVGAAITAIVADQQVPGVRAELSYGWHCAPMARTPEIAALAATAAACAQELGFSVKDAATGGVSYANTFAQLGLPVLDGLGPVGGLDHSPNEYILVSSIVPRTALLALLMLRRAQQE